MNDPQTTAPSSLLVFILALGAGIAVACLYYAQPILPLLQTDLQLSAQTIGWVPTLTQIGYAIGIFF